MATTPGGFPYPIGTDFVVDGDNAIRSLAEAVDARFADNLTAVASGIVKSVSTAGGGSAPVFWSDLLNVTFPVGLFTAAPVVFVQTIGPAGQVPFGGLVEAITAAGCKVRAMRVAAIPNDAFSVQWVAMQTVRFIPAA